MPEQDPYAHSVLEKPTDPPITFRGEELTPKRIVEQWQFVEALMEPLQAEVKRALGIRRGTLTRKISKSWADKNPEAAAAAPSRLPQRRTLEQDLKARTGVNEPAFVREAIGDLASDDTNAEVCQDYLNEWRTSKFGVPTATFLNKAVEDGGFARIRLPANLDLGGDLDFFDRLTERAHALLPKDEQKSYKEDRKGSSRRPYVKTDEKGNPVPSERWDRDARGRTRKQAEADAKKRGERADFKRDRNKSEEAHERAVRLYLLARPASTAQVLGPLDALPIFKRGIGREQAELSAIITRQLVTVDEAQEAGYAWKGMGNRRLVPRGYSEGRTSGQEGSYYLYAMYFCSEDDDGHERPVCAYTMGGHGTTFGVNEPESKDAVGLIDFYEEYKGHLEGPLWSWHWGLTTGDDEASYRGRPYLSDLADLILAIEGVETSIRAATNVNAFTGHVEDLSASLRGPNAEAVLSAVVEQGPNGKSIRTGKIPKPGEAASSLGEWKPFSQATIGQDAWRQLASDRQALAEATAVDQAASAPGSSGRAIVVGETLAKVAKRDIRVAIAEATGRDGEDHLRILSAIEQCYGYRWPIQKVEEPPVDAPENARPRYSIVEFDPDWIGEGQFRLKAEYAEEENLAAVDLEANLAERGFSHFANVAKKRGITNPRKEWQEVLEWEMRKDPAYREAIRLRLAQRRGDKVMVDLIKQLQAAQKLTKAGVPGAANGMPTAALRRMGERSNDQPGRGGPTAAAASRGGQQAADMQTASLNQEALAQMAVGQGAA